MGSRMEVSYLWRVFCESRVTRGDLVRLTSPWWPFVKTTRTGTNCPEKQSLWPFEDNNMNLYPTKWTIALRDKTREHDCSPQSPLVDDVLFHCFVLWLFIPLDQVGDIMKAVHVKKKQFQTCLCKCSFYFCIQSCLSNNYIQGKKIFSHNLRLFGMFSAKLLHYVTCIWQVLCLRKSAGTYDKEDQHCTFLLLQLR